VLVQFIDLHGSDSFVLSSSNINGACSLLFLSGDQDKVPLRELVLSDFLVDSLVGGINCNLPAFLMKIKVNAVDVWHVLFRDREYDGLPWRQEEWPLSTKMLNKNSHKSLD